METGAGLGCAGSRLVSGDDYRVFHYGKLQTKKQVEICTGTWSWLRRHLLQINPFRTIIPHWQKGLASPDKNWRHWPNSGKCGEAETACFSGDIDDALGCSIFSFCEKKKKNTKMRYWLRWPHVYTTSRCGQYFCPILLVILENIDTAFRLCLICIIIGLFQQ